MHIEKTLKQLHEITSNPRAQMDKYLAQGKKVVGCFPMYTPAPIAYAAGMIPVGIWGADVEPFWAKRFLPAFGCPIMQANLELGLNGTYRGMSAVMIPTLCDTFRCITQNWLIGVEDIPMIPVTYPQNRTDAGIEFLVSEFKLIAQRLQKISGCKITEESLIDAIETYNTHSRVMMEFTKVANEHLDVITPSVRHVVMKSAWFMDKKEHTVLMNTLLEELKSMPVYHSNAKRILLTGILAEPVELFGVLENNNLAIVADDLGQETRQYRTLIPQGSDPLHCLAEQWRDTVCSLAHDPQKVRISQMVETAKANNVQGVIACMMKFCDPEEYDFPLYNKALRKTGIPTLYLEIDMHIASVEQARTRIQTFSEML